MAIVDRPRRVLLSAVRPCADVEDMLIEQLALLHEADCEVDCGQTAKTVEMALKNGASSYKTIC